MLPAITMDKRHKTTLKRRKLKTISERNKRSVQQQYSQCLRSYPRKDVQTRNGQEMKKSAEKVQRLQTNGTDTVTRNRLTMPVGIFCQGRKSRSATRVSLNVCNEEMQARAQDDLNKILELVEPDVSKVINIQSLYQKYIPTANIDDTAIYNVPTTSGTSGTVIGFDIQHNNIALPSTKQVTLPDEFSHFHSDSSKSDKMTNGTIEDTADKLQNDVTSSEQISTVFLSSTIQRIHNYLSNKCTELYPQTNTVNQIKEDFSKLALTRNEFQESFTKDKVSQTGDGSSHLSNSKSHDIFYKDDGRPLIINVTSNMAQKEPYTVPFADDEAFKVQFNFEKNENTTLKFDSCNTKESLCRRVASKSNSQMLYNSIKYQWNDSEVKTQDMVDTINICSSDSSIGSSCSTLHTPPLRKHTPAFIHESHSSSHSTNSYSFWNPPCDMSPLRPPPMSPSTPWKYPRFKMF